MKRARVEEVQYSQRSSGAGGGGGGPTAHHRILTTQHSGGSTIQYQLAPTSPAGVLKTGNVSDGASSVGNVGLGQQPPTVQYTTGT